MTISAENITQLINEWQTGNETALKQLTPFVYQELKRLAKSYMQKEASGHTLQATALVNEAFIKVSGREVDYASRAHFFASAAKIMRHILVDHARAKQSQKRGGELDFTNFKDSNAAIQNNPQALIDVDRALNKLTVIDIELAKAVELIYFGGLNYEEAADYLGISRSKFYEDLRFAEAWLREEMQ